jgi:hypothetical protein
VRAPEEKSQLVFEIRSFIGDYGSKTLKVLTLDSDLERNVALVCLATTHNFSGNSRFKLGGYWVYPSIQASVWANSLGSFIAQILPTANLAIDELAAWPHLSAQDRANLSHLLGVTYFEADGIAIPSDNFHKLVGHLYDISSDYVMCHLQGKFMSINEYVKNWAQEPLLNLLSENSPTLAIASREGARQEMLGLEGGNLDPIQRRLYIEKISQVLTSQMQTSNAKAFEGTENAKYFLAMKSLQIRSAIIQDRDLAPHRASVRIGREIVTAHFVRD